MSGAATYSMREAAELLGVPLSTAYEWHRAGVFPAATIQPTRHRIRVVRYGPNGLDTALGLAAGHPSRDENPAGRKPPRPAGLIDSGSGSDAAEPDPSHSAPRSKRKDTER